MLDSVKLRKAHTFPPDIRNEIIQDLVEELINSKPLLRDRFAMAALTGLPDLPNKLRAKIAFETADELMALRQKTRLFKLTIDVQEIPPQFDIVHTQIIRASTPERAIEIAKQQARDEGTGAWEMANIEILSTIGPEELILAACT
jgi:hypothetical protein